MARSLVAVAQAPPQGDVTTPAGATPRRRTSLSVLPPEFYGMSGGGEVERNQPVTLSMVTEPSVPGEQIEVLHSMPNEFGQAPIRSSLSQDSDMLKDDREQYVLRRNLKKTESLRRLSLANNSTKDWSATEQLGDFSYSADQRSANAGKSEENDSASHASVGSELTPKGRRPQRRVSWCDAFDEKGKAAEIKTVHFIGETHNTVVKRLVLQQRAEATATDRRKTKTAKIESKQSSGGFAGRCSCM